MPSFECWMCGHHLPDWKNDFDGMQTMQSRFMWADHKWRHFEEALLKIANTKSFAAADLMEIAEKALVYKYECPK